MRTGGARAGAKAKRGGAARCLMAMSYRELRAVRRVRIKFDMGANWHP